MPVKIDPSFNKLHHLGTVPFKLHVSAGAMTTGKMILLVRRFKAGRDIFFELSISGKSFMLKKQNDSRKCCQSFILFIDIC
jgi:hypothetical protein